MRKLFSYFFCVILITSCNLKLEAPIAPNLQKMTADGNNGSQGNNTSKDGADNKAESSASQMLLQKSVSERNAGTKKFVFNLTLSNSLSKTILVGFCVQIARLKDEQIIVDFADMNCPTEGTLLTSDHIKYTAYLEEVKKDEEYKLVSAKSKKAIGGILADWSFPIARLDSICSGPEEANCKINISNNLFTGITD